jgi:F-type H+-transporting ATPase subunit gamma
MGANIKQIKSRIKSVDSTLHITKAMQLVASSKVRRAQQTALGATAYAQAMRDAFLGLVSNENRNSVFISPPPIGIPCYVLIAGDRGLAGGYNGNVFRLTEAEAAGKSAFFLPIGKRAHDFCRRMGYRVLSCDFLSSEKVSENEIATIASLLCDGIRDHSFDSVRILHTEMVSVLNQEAVSTPLLPLPTSEKASSAVVVYEPNAETLMEQAVADYVTALLTAAIRESFLCELYARRSAMDSATKNAEEMISSLNLQYNRARQSTITQEITEIVAGAEGQQ